jgi:hypothetical protein
MQRLHAIRGRARCSDLKVSSEFSFPVSSTSRVVHVGFLGFPLMAQPESVIHGLEAGCSPTSSDLCSRPRGPE